MPVLNKRKKLQPISSHDLPYWSLPFGIKAVLLSIAGPLLFVVTAVLAGRFFPQVAEFLRNNLDNSIIYAIIAAYYVPFIAYMFMKLRGRPNVLRDLGFKPFPVKTTIKYILAYPFVYFAIVLICIMIIIMIAKLLGFELTPDDIAPAQKESFNWPLFIAAVCIAPILEEVLFRGILLQAFARKYGWLKGSIFSSGIFSLMHGPIAPLIMIFSLYLSRMFYKTRSILPGMILHAINNAAVSLLLLGNL